jgi:hypothetical protein
LTFRVGKTFATECGAFGLPFISVKGENTGACMLRKFTREIALSRAYVYD